MATQAVNLFRRVARGIRGFVRRAAPMLRRVTRPFVRTIPSIVRRTISTFRRRINR